MYSVACKFIALSKLNSLDSRWFISLFLFQEATNDNSWKLHLYVLDCNDMSFLFSRYSENAYWATDKQCDVLWLHWCLLFIS